MADQLREILNKTVSSDPKDQEAALCFLNEAQKTNFPEFCKALSEVLLSAESGVVARQAAGLQLKNVLTGKDIAVKTTNIERWNALPPEIKGYIRANVINSLGTEETRPSVAAQCVAAIACAELPIQTENNVISQLMQNVTKPGSTEMLKESSLEAIGYICADIEPSVLGSRSNEILTAIVHGMKKAEDSDHVRLAATTALINSLEFTSSNFEAESERNVIMQVVCEATQSLNAHVRVAALQCLVKIVSLYYQLMEAYMGTALFGITVDAMRSDQDDVSLQGIEFWSNVCDEELNLAGEAEEAAELGRPPENVSKFYAKGALLHLMPIITQLLAKQDESDDEDDWVPAKAAGVCLMLMAQCVQDDVVPHVLPFITQNINSTDWRLKDAAVMAFGSILEGPDSEKLKPLVQQAMPFLINLLRDSNLVVKDTTAWCIGRVCETVPEIAVNPDVLQPLLPELSFALQQQPRVASNTCWAISSLAEAAYLAAQKEGNVDGHGHPATYILSSCFDDMITELLKTTERTDGAQSNLRNAAYEALMELIKNSPQDCYQTVQRATVIVLQRLQGLIAMEEQIQSTSDRTQFYDLESLLCASLQSVMKRIERADAPQITDIAMQTLLQILNSSNKVNSASVQEDAIMAIATIVEVCGPDFVKYMPAFIPFLYASLDNHAEYQTCSAAVGIIGDLCSALNEKIDGYVPEIMNRLLSILQDQMIDKSVKPQVLSVFGDLALQLGVAFTKYYEVVCATLSQASQTPVDMADIESVDFCLELRESCLEAYTGIIQGLKSDGPNAINLHEQARLIQPFLGDMISFLLTIASDSQLSESLLAAAAGLIGDLLSVFGQDIYKFLDQEPIKDMLTRARRSRITKTKSLATWAFGEMKKLRNSVAA